MFNLIRKDVIALKYYFLFIAAYAVMFGLFTVSSFSPLMICMLPAIMMTLFASNLELRNKSMLFIGSLPVRRKQIVLAKYGSVFVYLVLGIILAAAIRAINEYGLGVEFPLTSLNLSLSAALAMAFAALYYPIQFWLGVRNSSFISFLVIFLAAALIGGIGNMADSLTFDMLPTRAQLVIGLPIAGLLLLYVSYRISLNLFLRKDIEG
ncbi:ABC-2 transporter permease [Cohnella sp. LGH]|uniref:ABC-2 transporter permease n=1 Tax=Cohnella sp. LGH TaxID=1619153 RepID=UPI001ADBFAB3|nr:ABC-2 transporter permease [Cohnella sp. LGH]QTH39826.1 ABC-2 transporter permease [Cohnella sp. LGH]